MICCKVTSSPTSLLINVDFPALAAPMTATFNK